MKPKPTAPPAKVTPLWIVASFLSLTEVVLGYAVTKVSGSIQLALTIFVMSFAVAVAAMFFVILWNRPWVFYSPSEYGNVDPKSFMAALRGSPEVANQLLLAKSVEQNPTEPEVIFPLIDSMADIPEKQFIILMHEINRGVSRYSPYVYELGEVGSGSGSLSPFGRGQRIEGTGLIQVTDGGAEWSLTPQGNKFAEWLIKKGRKVQFFWSPTGGWGTPIPGGSAENALAEREKKRATRIVAVNPVPKT
jgi:hypothetical protein